MPMSDLAPERPRPYFDKAAVQQRTAQMITDFKNLFGFGQCVILRPSETSMVIAGAYIDRQRAIESKGEQDAPSNPHG
jgi:hypothetical protein